MMQRTRGEKLFNVFNVAALGVVGLLAIYPFAHTLCLSLSTAADAHRGGLHLIPREISFTAYKMVFANPQIATGFGNALLRVVVGTSLSLAFTCLFAYPLARREMPLRRPLTFFVLFTMIFGAGLVPNYLLIRSLGLLDNRLVYILPSLLSGFNVLIVKNFFQQVPQSFAESARLDGASEWSILWRIYVPLSLPVLATVGLWTAVSHWNMWFDALIYISSDSKQVLQTFLQRIVIENNTELIEKGVSNPDITSFTPETVKAATVVITVLPMLIVYPFVQRFFVKGVLLGGVKE